MQRRIRLKTCLAGVDHVLRPGEEITLGVEAAEAWVRAGMAVYLDGPERVQVETATIEAPETAALRPGRKRRGN